MSKITQLKLENFTAFHSIDVRFSPGVNVLIGANGTGKTHLLKVLYAACAITVGEDRERGFERKLAGVFHPFQSDLSRLIRRRPGRSGGAALAVWRDDGTMLLGGITPQLVDSRHASTPQVSAWAETPLESAYIPVKEMLAHAPGFLSTAARREIAFEEVYVDILRQAFLPKLKGDLDPDRQRLLDLLQQAIGGKVISKGEHFFLKNRRGELEFTLLAEGMRKLALLWLLIQNGTLRPGSVLFWDEPEANLNPALMGDVIEVVLALQRLGVQVFMSTHNYVMLKELDLRTQSHDQVRYLSLFRGASDSVTCQSSEHYASIDPNAMAATFDSLYARDMARALQGVGRA